MPTTAAAPVRVPGIVGLFNPLARRLLHAGVPLGPNALLTVRGRKSGQPRTTPVALVEVKGLVESAALVEIETTAVVPD